MPYLTCLSNITDFSEAKQILEEKKLRVVDTGIDDLYIVKYDKSVCDMSDMDVKRCRGLILSKTNNQLVCPVPSKSESIDYFIENWNDNNNFIIEEFIDGTMINMFTHNGTNYISTRSNLGARCRWSSSKTFRIMFDECTQDINLESLDTDYCYSFVILHPDNRIVKQYTKPSLCLTMVSKILADGSVEYFDPEVFLKNNPFMNSLNIIVPKKLIFSCHIADMYKYIDNFKNNEQGLVLKKKNNIQYRSKIRNSTYNYIRSLKGTTNNKMYLFFELRRNGGTKEYLKYFSEDTDIFEEYRKRLYTITNNLLQFYLRCFVKKEINHRDVEYEYKPLVSDLYKAYKLDSLVTNKTKVINYLHRLPIPKLIFVMNYKFRKQTPPVSSEDFPELTLETTNVQKLETVPNK